MIFNFFSSLMCVLRGEEDINKHDVVGFDFFLFNLS